MKALSKSWLLLYDRSRGGSVLRVAIELAYERDLVFAGVILILRLICTTRDGGRISTAAVRLLASVRLLLPIMEASSVEVNETLQDMWAGLLATASQDTDPVSASFAETLKQLTPDAARHLQRMYANHLQMPTLAGFIRLSLTRGYPRMCRSTPMRVLV